MTRSPRIFLLCALLICIGVACDDDDQASSSTLDIDVDAGCADGCADTVEEDCAALCANVVACANTTCALDALTHDDCMSACVSGDPVPGVDDSTACPDVNVVLCEDPSLQEVCHCSESVCGDGDCDTDEDFAGCALDCEAIVSGFEASSVITSLVLPDSDPDTGEPLCCKDFGSSSRYEGRDNTLSAVADLLSGLTGDDTNALIAEDIQTGASTYLLDHVALDGADDPDGFSLVSARGEWAEGTDWSAVNSGAGAFLADAAYFDASGAALDVFMASFMSSGAMISGRSASPFVIDFPCLGLRLRLPLSDAEMSGDAMISPEGVSYIGGELSGIVTLSDFFGAINEATSDCACLGLDGADLIEGSGVTWSCNARTNANFGACVNSPNPSCLSLGGLPADACERVTGILIHVADIDADGDGVYDALAAGLMWTAAEAAITAP